MALPSDLVPISLSLISDPDPISHGDPERGRARTKTQAKPPTQFSALLSAFVDLWQRAYSDKYPFEVKDAAQVSLMLKTHPEYGDVERWRAMVTRYLADEFYGRKRHPLALLASKAREFAGEAGGLPAKVAASRDTARSWAAKGAR